MITKTLRKSMARPPALVLKDLRKRADLTAKDCADFLVKALKKKDRRTGKPLTEGAPTVWFRYESLRDMGERKIPYKIVRAIIPLFVGRGTPAITEGELLAVSEVHDMTSDRRANRSVGVAKVSVGEMAPVFPRTEEGVKPLIVRYRAERGTYMLAEQLEKRSFGVGPITEATEYKSDQACVVVGDDHADPVYPAGTVLHIIHMTAYAPSELKGRRVAVSVKDKKIGLFEVVIGRIDDVVGNSYVIKSLQGEDLDGEILGVVHRSLHRE